MREIADELRQVVIGLISVAAAEEAMLLASLPWSDEAGNADVWAARPTIAHTSEFRDEQVQRLVAIRDGSTPPEFARVEHHSAETYRRYAAVDDESVWQRSRATNAALIEETQRCSDEDLLDPSRNPWLRGRQLWLQIIVRGFWHPTGHLGDYYLQHDQPERALALHAHALATAEYLKAPAMAIGMANYSLACTQAVTGREEAAVVSLLLAVARNPDLREHARGEPDLRELSDAGRLLAVLG